MYLTISSLQVWHNIKPQLEETIQLRRTHVGHKFHAKRRQKRQDELTDRFAKFRPQLQHTPKEKLFLQSDFLELPLVKAFIEENDCREPLTDERWQLVADALFEEVPKHAKAIEKDCLNGIGVAIEEASKIIGRRLLFKNNESDRMEEDDDTVPPCFLSATSLFRRHGSDMLLSYSEILSRRTWPPLIKMHEKYRLAWMKETFASTGRIISTAAHLLECLRLPPETTMAHMLACGSTFECMRCNFGPGSQVMSWPDLVRCSGGFQNLLMY